MENVIVFFFFKVFSIYFIVTVRFLEHCNGDRGQNYDIEQIGYISTDKSFFKNL